MREFTLHLKDGYFVAGVGGLDSKNMLTAIPKSDHDQAIAEKDARIALLEAKLELAVRQRNETVVHNCSRWRNEAPASVSFEDMHQAVKDDIRAYDAELSALTLKEKGEG